MADQSVGEYAASLKNRVAEAFDLVWMNVACVPKGTLDQKVHGQHVYQKKFYDQKVHRQHVYQKELNDQKVHVQPFSTEDWVWLYSLVVSK